MDKRLAAHPINTGAKNMNSPHMGQHQSKIKVAKLNNTNVKGPVLTYAVKTRQGFIPGQKKTNQDSFVIHNDFAGIKNLWMMGVCDGHGAHGHLVSNFVKQNMPKILSDLIN